MNTTLIQGKALAGYDAVVLSALNFVPPENHHYAEEQLHIGVRNERGEIYRVIKVAGLNGFLELIAKFRGLGFDDEFAEYYGEKQGFDAIVSAPRKS